MVPGGKGRKSRFRIEQLEERIAPVVHPLVPVFANGAFAASDGNAAGGNAEVSRGGPLGSAGHPVGTVAPVINPAVGGFDSIADFPETGRGIP
jgi:hypothetical protein